MEKKLKKLQEYIDSTMGDIDNLMNKRKKFFKIQILIFVGFVMSIFSPWLILWAIFLNLWLFSIMYEHLGLSMPLSKKFGTIDGCFDTLRILGLLEEEPPKAPKKKSKKWFESVYAETKKIIENIKWPEKGFAPA